MLYGLTITEIKLIQGVFIKYPDVEEVKIFGSRALGSSQKNSDIDLVLFGNIPQRVFGIIALDLDDLPLPYLFDVKSINELSHPQLLEHIKLFAKTIYPSLPEKGSP